MFIMSTYTTWFPAAPGSSHEWEGVCARCGTRREAIQLELRRLPFSSEEAFFCHNSCYVPSGFTRSANAMLVLLRSMKRNGEI
jgi:hypothetical protein